MTGVEMQAIVRRAGAARLVRREIALTRPGWARVRVRLAGLCRTDLFAARGDIPVAEGRVLGHEVVGECDGARVTVAPMVPCGACAACSAGVGCASPGMLGLSHDGAFAEWLDAPVDHVFSVPDAMDDRRAAYVEPVAASLAVLRAPIRPTDRGLVLGRGRIAELTRRVLAEHGFARVAHADDGVPRASCDFVVETEASADVLTAALDAVRPGGVVVLKSRPANPIPIDVKRAVLSDVTFAAVSYGAFPDAIDLAARMRIDDLLGATFPLSRFDEAFTRAAEPHSPKLFLDVEGR